MIQEKKPYITTDKAICPVCRGEAIITVTNWAERYLSTLQCMRQFNDHFHDLWIGAEGSTPEKARHNLNKQLSKYARLKGGNNMPEQAKFCPFCGGTITRWNAGGSRNICDCCKAVFYVYEDETSEREV